MKIKDIFESLKHNINLSNAKSTLKTIINNVQNGMMSNQQAVESLEELLNDVRKIIYSDEYWKLASSEEEATRLGNEWITLENTIENQIQRLT
jgi:ribosomal protein S20